LGLCGDWLHGGKVEGAWLSGQALAARLMAGVQAA
jgi:renalase